MVYRLLVILFCGFLNVMHCLGSAASDDEAPTGIKAIYLVSEDGEETAFTIPCGTRKGLKDFFEANRECEGVHTMNLSSNASLTTEGIEELVSWLSDKTVWPCLEVLSVDKVVADLEGICLLLPLLDRPHLLINARENVRVGFDYAFLYEQSVKAIKLTEQEIEQCTADGETDVEGKKKAIERNYLNRLTLF